MGTISKRMKKTNWLNVTNRINSERFQIPAGWETKEQVAESLQCSPDKVAELLKPGIASGDIERSTFPTWNEKRRLVEQVVCYREKPADAPQAASKVTTPGKGPDSLQDRIAAKIRANPGLSNAAIAKQFHVMHGVNAAKVAEVRAMV